MIKLIFTVSKFIPLLVKILYCYLHLCFIILNLLKIDVINKPIYLFVLELLHIKCYIKNYI